MKIRLHLTFLFCAFLFSCSNPDHGFKILYPGFEEVQLGMKLEDVQKKIQLKVLTDQVLFHIPILSVAVVENTEFFDNAVLYFEPSTRALINVILFHGDNEKVNKKKVEEFLSEKYGIVPNRNTSEMSEAKSFVEVGDYYLSFEIGSKFGPKYSYIVPKKSYVYFLGERKTQH